MTAEQLAKRNAAIRLAWDDPLLRSVQSKTIERVRNVGPFRGAVDRRAYMRAYMRRRRAKE